MGGGGVENREENHLKRGTRGRKKKSKAFRN